MRRSGKPKPISLTLAKQEKFKEQILIVLEDYRNMKDPLEHKHEMADRIMMNLRVVATMKL